MTTNSNFAAAARQRKADAIVVALLDRWAELCASTGVDAALDRRALAGWPQEHRDAIARAAGVRPPSPESWELVVEQAVAAGPQTLCRHGKRLRAGIPCPDWHDDPFARIG